MGFAIVGVRGSQAGQRISLMLLNRQPGFDCSQICLAALELAAVTTARWSVLSLEFLRLKVISYFFIEPQLLERA